MANQVNYLSQIQTGQTIQAVHVNQFVDALSGSAAYDLRVSGSLTVVGPLNATASLSLVAFNANTSSKANTIYMNNLGTTNKNYRPAFVDPLYIPNIGGNFYDSLVVDSGSDGSGLYYNPSTNRLFVGSISSSDYSSDVRLYGTASYALTASYYPYGTNVLSVGSFYDMTTQTVLQNTSASITFNTTDISDGIALSAPTSRIQVTKTGTYNIQFSFQTTLAAGGGGTAYIWLRKNGVNVTNSNTGIYMQNSNDKHVVAWNFVQNLNALDYIELVMWGQGADVRIVTEAATPGAGGNGNVAVPSVICTVTQIK